MIFIVNPNTFEKYSLFSRKGTSLLKNYVKLYQSGGADGSGGGGAAGDSREIPSKIMSYNLSWATQLNDINGTEWEFVEKCKDKYSDDSSKCTSNMAEYFKKMNLIPDILALQEVTDKTLELFVSPLMGKNINVFVKEIPDESKGNPKIMIVSNKKYGEGVDIKVDGDDLGWSGKYGPDGRPRQCIYFPDIHTLILNSHFPHGWTKKQYTENLETYGKSVMSILKTHLTQDKTIKNIRIVYTGDFNDHSSELFDMIKTDTKPNGFKNYRRASIKFLDRELTMGSEHSPPIPKTCCYPEYELHSDYIFDTMPQTYVGNIHFDKGGLQRFLREENPIGSDHDPIIAFNHSDHKPIILLKHNTTINSSKLILNSGVLKSAAEICPENAPTHYCDPNAIFFSLCSFENKEGDAELHNDDVVIYMTFDLEKLNNSGINYYINLAQSFIPLDKTQIHKKKNLSKTPNKKECWSKCVTSYIKDETDLDPKTYGGTAPNEMENPCRVTDDENRDKMIQELVMRTDNLDPRCGEETEGEFVIRAPQISVKPEDIFKISISKEEYDKLNGEEKTLFDTYPLTIRKSKTSVDRTGGIDLSYMIGL
jgi:hypothetical protein